MSLRLGSIEGYQFQQDDTSLMKESSKHMDLTRGHLYGHLSLHTSIIAGSLDECHAKVFCAEIQKTVIVSYTLQPNGLIVCRPRVHADPHAQEASRLNALHQHCTTCENDVIAANWIIFSMRGSCKVHDGPVHIIGEDGFTLETINVLSLIHIWRCRRRG